MDGEIQNLNNRLNNNIHERDAEMSSLSARRNELFQVSEQYKEIDAQVKKLEPRANDPLQSRPFFAAMTRRANIYTVVQEKQGLVTASETRINQFNADISRLREEIVQANEKRNMIITHINEAEDQLKIAKNNLINSQIKDAADSVIGFYQTLTEKYGQKYSLLAQDIAEKSKGKKIGNVNEALAAFEKYQDVLNKKFSKADRDAIFNALESVKYDDWAKHLDKFAKYLKITGRVSFGYDLVSDVLKVRDTGDWKPLFLTLEKKAVDTGLSYLVVLMFSLIAGTTLGIWGVAIVTGILCSFIDKSMLNDLNEALGI